MTDLLSPINQPSPLDDSCGSLCFRYCHVLPSIVFIDPDSIETNELVLPKLNAPLSTVTTHHEEAEKEAYSQAFSIIKSLLNEAQPKVEKVVLSRRLHCTSLNLTQAHELFAKACLYRPSSYVALWHTPQTGSWLIATPEPLLEYAHHQWNTVALAGTLPFVEGIEPQWNEKNREEQAIVARFIEEQMQGVATHVQKSEPSLCKQVICNTSAHTLNSTLLQTMMCALCSKNFILHLPYVVCLAKQHYKPFCTPKLPHDNIMPDLVVPCF